MVYLLSVVLIEVKKKEKKKPVGSAPDNPQQAPSVEPAQSSAPISIDTSGHLAADGTASPQQDLLASAGDSPLRRSISSAKSAKQESDDSDISKQDCDAEDYLEVGAGNFRPPERTATTDNITTTGTIEAAPEEEEEEKSSEASVEDGLGNSSSPPATPPPPLGSPSPVFSPQPASAGTSPLWRLSISSSKSVKQESEDSNSSKEDYGAEDYLEAEAGNGLHHLHDEEKDNEDYSMGSKVMRAVFSIFALDWIILYFVYTVALFVFWSQQAFLTGKYMIHTAHKKAPMDRRCPASTKVKVFVDAFTYDRDLARLRKYATNAQLCRLPLCDGWVFTDTAETVADRIQEDAEWKEVEKTLPSYFDFAMDVRKEMEDKLKDTWMEDSLPYVLCHWFITQIMFTKVGRETWLRVCKTYFGMILLCMGIWPEWLVRDFKIIEKFEEFKRQNEAIYRQVGNGVFSNPLEDAFTKIDNDERVSFGQFVSAVTMCRIALLQIEPSLTVWAVFASSVAASPLFVCEAMHQKLSPLIATDAFQWAYHLLKETYNKKPPMIQTAFLGWYIFVNQSRIIQFMLAGFLNIVSIGIIFFPQHLKHLIPPLVILIVHYGLLQSIYVVYMFKKLLFPEVTEEISPTEVPRILALDDDDDITPEDIELMQRPRDSPSMTSPTPAAAPLPIRPFSVHRGNDSIMSEKDDSPTMRRLL